MIKFPLSKHLDMKAYREQGGKAPCNSMPLKYVGQVGRSKLQCYTVDRRLNNVEKIITRL
jgi:hypothetical protein